MPFRKMNGYTYTPEKLVQLQMIFDDIWKQIAPNAQNPSQATFLRDAVARKIILAEQRGLGPEAIRETVLRQLDH